MCIDTLHVDFRTPYSPTLSRSDDVDRDVPDYQSMIDALEEEGYEVADYSWNRGGVTRFKFKIKINGCTAMEVTGSAYNTNYARLDALKCNPSRFGSYEDFTHVLRIMWANSYNDILRTGKVKRIDYACDYLMPFRDLIGGLYYGANSTVYGYRDMDSPYEEYQMSHGGISSFKLGMKYKVIKAYDKARQLRYIGTLNTTGRSRIEVSLTQNNQIKGRWGCMGRVYEATLGELDDHLRDIAAGRCKPFEGILLNHVLLDTSDQHGFTRVENEANSRLRFLASEGVLNRITQETRYYDQDFWEAHANAFALIPFRIGYQPTTVYRARMNGWLNGVTGYNQNGIAMPDNWQDYCNPERITASPWPMRLTGTRARLRPERRQIAA